MGTSGGCVSPSLSPYFFMQPREQPDVIFHTLECTQPRFTPIKGLFSTHATYTQYRIIYYVYADIGREQFTWCPLRGDQCFYVLSWREEHGLFVFLPN